MIRRASIPAHLYSASVVGFLFKNVDSYKDSINSSMSIVFHPGECSELQTGSKSFQLSYY